MDFELSDERKAIVDGVARTIGAFDDAYWLERDRDGEFPHASGYPFPKPMAEPGSA